MNYTIANQQSVHIFKADFRGVENSDEYRCLSTLMYHDNPSETESPLGKLTVLEDETLAPKKKKLYFIQEDTVVILMPLVGMLEIEEPGSISHKIIAPEELSVIPLKKGQVFVLSNPYEKELVNFLQIRVNVKTSPFKKHFGGMENNQLSSIFKSKDCTINFGVFDGRREGIYQLKNSANGIFAYVINGAFELENRLLENRDGLSINNKKRIEFEALSENAILLLIEVPYI